MASLCLRIARPLAASAARHPRHAFSPSASRYIVTLTPAILVKPPADTEGMPIEEALEEDDLPDDEGPPEGPSGFQPKSTRNPVTLSSNAAEAASPPLVDVEHHLHVTCTRNNTLITLANEKGEPVPRGVWTGGSCGFKGVNRSGYEAGYQCVVRAFARMKEIGEVVPGARLEVIFKGSGHGRDATFKALMTSEGDGIRPLVSRVTDATPIKIGGTRAKKMRR